MQFVQKWNYSTKDPEVKKTYAAWLSARRRCHNPKDRGYSDYGGRGIVMCERWKNDFDTFVSDMGFAPKGKTIERIDVNGDYDPFNCVWATRKEQANNTRKNVKVTIGTRTMTATQWAEELGISPTRLLSRLRRGWEPKKAINPEIYKAPHGGNQKYMTGCRCEICILGRRKRANLAYRKRNPTVKNRSINNPDKTC